MGDSLRFSQSNYFGQYSNMGKRVVVVLLFALATLQVLEATELEKSPIPDYTDEETEASRFAQPDTWAASTQWLGALRSSYSQILRYEADKTLKGMMNFASNIEKPTQEYKEQVQEILADDDKPNYLKCTGDTKFNKLQEMISTEDQNLRKCAESLKTLHDEYKNTLESLTGEVESQSEETIYKDCLPTDSTVSLDDRAGKCFYASIQVALSRFYYPMGATVLRTVTEFRSSIAHTQDSARACAEQYMLRSAANMEAISQYLEMTTSCLHPSRSRVRRGFGKKFKKFFRKAKHGIKKFCNTVPCQIGYSVPFG